MIDKKQVDAVVQLSEEQILNTLRSGIIEEKGLLPYSSNHSFLVVVADEALILPAVYKPQRGENPLWDFELGTLCRRETAAYAVSAALAWQLVPPTVLRLGTRGLGSVQFFVDHDADEHYFTVQADARFWQSLRRLALFDYVINNADRKSGHCLIGSDNRMWAIDHGICFHAEYKLRTVIWEFSREPIEDELLADLADFQRSLEEPCAEEAEELSRLLSPDEYAAMCERVARLLMHQHYPAPSPFQRNFPWPPV